jgi:hypothetical protein
MSPPERYPKDVNIATLRGNALNRLRDQGAANIAAAVRDRSYAPFAIPLDILGISDRPGGTPEKCDFATALGDQFSGP